MSVLYTSHKPSAEPVPGCLIALKIEYVYMSPRLLAGSNESSQVLDPYDAVWSPV